ncbi:MAG: phage tail tape measure protein [Spirochaetota bacterium]
MSSVGDIFTGKLLGDMVDNHLDKLSAKWGSVKNKVKELNANIILSELATIKLQKATNNVEDEVSQLVEKTSKLKDELKIIDTKGLLEYEKGVSNLNKGFIALTSSVLVFKGFASIVNEAATFTQKLNPFKKQMESFSELSLKMSKNTTASATEIAASMLTLKKAGITGSEAIKKELVPALNLMAMSAETLSLEQAIQQIQNVKRNFKDQGVTAEKVADTFANMLKISTFAANELGPMWKSVSAEAGAANQSLSSTGIVLGALKDSGYVATGLKGVGEAFTSALTAIHSPSKEAQKALKDLGGVRLTDKNTGQLRDMVVIFEELRQKMKDKGIVEDQAILKTILGTKGMIAYNAVMKEGRKSVGELSEVMNQSGNSSSFAKNYLESYQGSLTNLSKSWSDLKVVLGESFVPIITKIFQGLTKLISGTTDFFLKYKGAAKLVGWAIPIIGGLTAAAGATLLLKGAILTGMIPAMGKLGAAILATPVGWIALGVVATIAAITAVVYWWDEWTGALAKWWEAATVFGVLLGVLGGVIAAAGFPIIGIIVLIGTLIGYVGLLQAKWDDLVLSFKKRFGIGNKNELQLKIGVSADKKALNLKEEQIKALEEEQKKLEKTGLKESHTYKDNIKDLNRYINHRNELQTSLKNEETARERIIKLSEEKKALEGIKKSLDSEDRDSVQKKIKDKEEEIQKLKEQGAKALPKSALVPPPPPPPAPGKKQTFNATQLGSTKLANLGNITPAAMKSFEQLPQAIPKSLDATKAELDKVMATHGDGLGKTFGKGFLKGLERFFKTGAIGKNFYASARKMFASINNLAFSRGKSFIATYAAGIRSQEDSKGDLTAAVSDTLRKVTDHLNSSDAKKGPLSKTTQYGKNFVSTYSKGIQIEGKSGKIDTALNDTLKKPAKTLAQPFNRDQKLSDKVNSENGQKVVNYNFSNLIGKADLTSKKNAGVIMNILESLIDGEVERYEAV